MVTYNLLEERWLPCTMPDGTASAESIRTALEHAHERTEITTPSPVITIALHRLLLAVIHRAIRPPSAAAGPADAGEWEKLWQRGAFDMVVIGSYLDSQRANFDLFDAARPFYQDASLDPEYARPITSIAHEITTDGPTLFDHTTGDEGVAFSPALAAQYLVAFHTFAIGGLLSFEKGQDRKVFGSADSGPLTKGAPVLLRGETLFHTLMLNVVRYDRQDDEPFSMQRDDLPAWERIDPTRAEDRTPRGYLDLLTWQSRRVRLYPDRDEAGNIVIRTVTTMKGNQFPDAYMRYGRETMLAFRTRKNAKPNDDPHPVLTLLPERSVWRDSQSLFMAQGECSKTLKWVGDLMATDALQPTRIFRLDVCGLCADRAKVFFWRHERLPLPLAYLSDGDLRATLDNALAHAERVGRALDTAALWFARWVFVPEPPTDRRERDVRYRGRSKDIAALKTELAPGRRYWPALDTAFAVFLIAQAAERAASGTTGQIRIGPAFREWTETVRQAARDDLRVMVGSQDATARVLRARVVAEQVFYGALKRARDATGATAEEVASGDE